MDDEYYLVWVVDQLGQPRRKSGPGISSIGRNGSC